MQPATLGRYRIDRVLGRGGMGVVYVGHDPQIDRPVAIKTIALQALSADEQAMFEARFHAEMRSSGRLQHHNIAALYDTGRDGGTAFIVMELVDGQDLRRRLAAGERFTMAQALDIMTQLLAALAFAHRHHVIHRDVKPANVMLRDDGVVKLCDFGVARLTDADATRTQGLVVGSLGYASPEQIAGQPLDERTDVFSAGVVLFELLTGRPPFQGRTDAEVLHRISTFEAPSARALNAAVPPELDAAVRQALARDPDQRFASADDFARALRAATGASTNPGAEPPIAATAAPTQPRRRRRALWLAPVAALLAVAAWALWRMLTPAPAPTVASAPAPTASTASPASSAIPQTASTEASAPASAALPVPAAASPVAIPAPTRPASTPAPPKARPADGLWTGQLRCGASRLPGATGPGSAAFVGDVEVTITGSQLSWARSTKTQRETGSGSIDARGHFSFEGTGRFDNGRSSWQLRGQGQLRGAALEGEVQLLGPAHGFVTRECTLNAQRAAARAPAAPAVPAVPSAAAPAPPPTPVRPQSWPGELSCGPLLNAPSTALRREPFTASLTVDLGDRRVGWVRESRTVYESVSGPLDAGGRFTAEGEGHYKDEAARNPWRARAQGQLDARRQVLEARVQLLRQKDGVLTRECTLRARRP